MPRSNLHRNFLQGIRYFPRYACHEDAHARPAKSFGALWSFPAIICCGVLDRPRTFSSRKSKSLPRRSNRPGPRCSAGMPAGTGTAPGREPCAIKAGGCETTNVNAPSSGSARLEAGAGNHNQRMLEENAARRACRFLLSPIRNLVGNCFWCLMATRVPHGQPKLARGNFSPSEPQFHEIPKAPNHGCWHTCRRFEFDGVDTPLAITNCLAQGTESTLSG